MYSSTKASQFTAKVNALGELNNRLVDGNPNNDNTIREIITSLKYFESTLLGWVKDSHPCFSMRIRDFDREKFPLVDYQHLHECILNLIPGLQNNEDKELHDAIVSSLACTFPFISYETFIALPTTLAEALYDQPQSLQHKLIDLLCQYVIPLIYSFMTENVDDDMAEINLMVPSVLASILDATTDAASWTKIMECFMRFKRTVSSDLLTVLAYGTKESLEASIHLLNRYFPPVDIASTKAYQSPPYENILPFRCQNPDCMQPPDKQEAVMLCLDPGVCASHANAVPPMYLCEKCYKAIDKMDSELFTHVIQPCTLVSQVCDNIDCRFGFMKAVYFCYSLDCVKKNDYKPIRLCEDCHSRLHLNERHMNHECLKELWITDNPEQSYLVDAIVRLWSEAQPNFQEKCSAMGLTLDLENIDKSQQDPVYYIKKVFGSLHGLWLLKTTCPIPPTQYHLENLGRLLSMLFVWVESVEYASHPKAVQIVKPNRQQAIGWITKVQKYDLDLYCNCLLPNPPMYARVGHPWDMLTSVTRKDMEILQRIVTLTKNGLIPEQVWDKIMPEWIQEIQSRIPVSDVKQFRIILKELFDMKSDIRPDYALNFIKKHLESSILKQSQEGLVWVQILSYLDVQMEITSLLDMFIEMLINKGDSVSNVEHVIESVFPFPDKKTLHKVTSTGTLSRQNSGHSAPATSPHNAGLPTMKNVQDDLSITVLILDVLIKQLTLQKSMVGNVYIADKESISLNVLLVCILDQTFQGEHVTIPDFHCPKCQVMNTIYYLVALLIDLAVRKQVTVDPLKAEFTKSVNSRRNSSNASRKSRMSTKTSGSSSWPSKAMNGADSPDKESVNSLPRTKTGFTSMHVEYDADEDLHGDLAKGEGTKLSTLPPHITKEQVLQMQRQRNRSDISESALNVIPELQILEKLLQELAESHEATVALHILTSLDVLCVRGGCLQMVAEENMDVLNRLQTNLIIPNLWRLLDSTKSNLAQTIVPLLLHCASLPFGAERLCEEMEFDFTREDWKVRFSAVEKLGLICQFFSKDHVIGSGHAQSSVIHGVCYLTTAVQDTNVTVSIRARCVIQSIKISSLKLIYGFMEDHFKKILEDRMLLLDAFRTIHMIIPEASPLSGEFFLKILNVAKYVEDPRKSQVSLDGFMHVEDHYGLVILPINTRDMTSKRKMFGYKVGQTPMDVYRSNFTLQKGQTWKHKNSENQGESVGYPNLKRIATALSSEFIPGGDGGLGTLAEEDEDLYRSSSSIHNSSVTLETSSREDEILSYLVSFLFEFLSKETKEKIDKELGSTGYDEIRRIINYFGQGMGLQRLGAQDWEVNKTMNIKHFRKNPIFVAYLMNLPRLLDGNIERGNSFMRLTLVVMETCVKGQTTDNNNVLCLNRLEPALLRVWLLSLIVILYKYNIQDSDHKDTIWRLILIVKNTLAGHNRHYCCSKLAQQHVVSLKHVVNIKANLKNFKRKHDKGDRSVAGGGSGGNGEVEMTDFTALPMENLTLERKPRESRNSKSSEIVESVGTTEELLFETNKTLCNKCGLVLFNYEQEAVDFCIIALLTYIHMDPESAAPLLIDVIQSVALEASVFSHSNSSETPKLGLTPTASVAQQFLRCVFYKLAPSRLFPELFSVSNHEDDFFLIVATVLQDFPYMTQLDPIKLILHDLVPGDHHNDHPTLQVMRNLTAYMKHVINNPTNQWNTLRNPLQTFFTNAPALIPKSENLDCVLQMMSMLLVSQKSAVKFFIEEMDTTLTYIIKYCTFSVHALCDLTTACYDAFTKDRDQLKFVRKLSFLLANALSGRASMMESSMVRIVQFFCNDAGTKFELEELPLSKPLVVNSAKVTRAVEALDMSYASEVIEYLKAPSRRFKDSSNNDGERSEQLPSQIKLAISQFISVYVSKMDPTSESRFYYKLLAVLCVDQSQDRLHFQATNLDLQEYTTHFRVYSWILLGAINHSVMMNVPVIPLIPLQKAAQISEYIDVVFENIVNEPSEDLMKKSKSRAQLHFTFLLMQIWNVYIERHYTVQQMNLLHGIDPISVIKQFWSKLTPMLYSLIQHSPKLQVECISLFSSLVESISIHCPRTFSQFYSMWQPLLDLYVNEIPSSVKQKIKDFNNVTNKGGKETSKQVLLKNWVADMHKKLWNTERMLKGKTTTTVNV